MAYKLIAVFFSIFVLTVLALSVSVINAHPNSGTATTTVEEERVFVGNMQMRKYTVENDKGEKGISLSRKLMPGMDDECDQRCTHRSAYCDVDLGCSCNFDISRCRYNPQPDYDSFDAYFAAQQQEVIGSSSVESVGPTNNVNVADESGIPAVNGDESNYPTEEDDYCISCKCC